MLHKNKSVVSVCAMLLITAAIGAACTAKPDGEPALAEVTVFEPVTPTPTAEPAPVTTDSSLPTGEYGDMKDSASSPEEGYSIPIATGISEADNTPSLSTPTPVPAPTATPKPTSKTSPTPTATTKPTATPLPTSTPMIPPIPTLTPTPTAIPAPILTPAPTPTPEAPKARTMCNICGADITGNVPPHGDSHLLNGEDFSYRVE